MRNHAIDERQLHSITSTSGEVFVRSPMRPAAAVIRRAADIILDALMLLAVILSIPFVILAIGTPIALVVRLLLWIGGLL